MDGRAVVDDIKRKRSDWILLEMDGRAVVDDIKRKRSDRIVNERAIMTQMDYFRENIQLLEDDVPIWS